MVTNIPTGALTHLYFSFGYISPGTFDLIPMDDLKPELFEQFTDVKRSNHGLKVSFYHVFQSKDNEPR